MKEWVQVLESDGRHRKKLYKHRCKVGYGPSDIVYGTTETLDVGETYLVYHGYEALQPIRLTCDCAGMMNGEPFYRLKK